MDRGAWWAAVYRVAQSWTRLKRLGSSSKASLLHRRERRKEGRGRQGGREEKKERKGERKCESILRAAGERSLALLLLFSVCPASVRLGQS